MKSYFRLSSVHAICGWFYWMSSKICKYAYHRKTKLLCFGDAIHKKNFIIKFYTTLKFHWSIFVFLFIIVRESKRSARDIILTGFLCIIIPNIWKKLELDYSMQSLMATGYPSLTYIYILIYFIDIPRYPGYIVRISTGYGTEPKI